MKSKMRKARTAEHKHSRAALSTIEMAVATVGASIEQLSKLQGELHNARNATLTTFLAARDHALKGCDLRLIEAFASELAERRNWPERVRSRAQREDLERPLSEHESWEIGRCAATAYTVAQCMIAAHEGFEEGYGLLVLSSVNAARSALLKVTVEAHIVEAEELMHQLDQLCADKRIAGALAMADRDDLGICLGEDDDMTQYDRPTRRQLH
jgi:hypothetical protein